MSGITLVLVRGKSSNFSFSNVLGEGPLQVREAITAIQDKTDPSVWYYAGWKTVRRYRKDELREAVKFAESIQFKKMIPVEVVMDGRKGSKSVLFRTELI